MNISLLIIGIVVIVVGFFVIAFSKATEKLAQSGDIPSKQVLYLTLPSGTKVAVLAVMGFLMIVPGVLLLAASVMR